MGSAVGDNADWYVNASFQHVGSRYTQPGDQENNPRSFDVIGLDPFTGAAGNGRDRRRPQAAVLRSGQPVRRPRLGQRPGASWLYVNNLFDENAMLSFDRERGGRARLGFNIGQPRTIGLTIR